MIGKACVADGIAVLGLRRITLLEEQIAVEWVSRTGKWKTHTYPLLNKRRANCPVRRFVCSSRPDALRLKGAKALSELWKALQSASNRETWAGTQRSRPDWPSARQLGAQGAGLSINRRTL